MTELVWDQAGDRRYETGIDRGVLYLPDGSAVPWNGLTEVDETLNREVKSFFIDGINYLNSRVPGAYRAKLSAFTYPQELDALLGSAEFAPGVFLHDQRSKLFSLSYRTQLGDDLVGTERGYRIHVVYNVLANQNDHAAKTQSNSTELDPFTFDLSAAPSVVFGVRPTAHISIDSTRVDPELLDALETLLYGDVAVDPSLPDLVDFLGLVET